MDSSKKGYGKRTLLAGSHYSFPERDGLDILKMDWQDFLKFIEEREFQTREIRVLGFDRKSLDNLFSLMSLRRDQVLSRDEAKRLFKGLKAIGESLENTDVYFVSGEEKPWISAFYIPGARKMELSAAIDALIESERKKRNLRP